MKKRIELSGRFHIVKSMRNSPGREVSDGEIMRICFILEGSYPYVRGGVSNWIDLMIRNLPEYEFVLHTIIYSREQSGDFKYVFPSNLTHINECFLRDDDRIQRFKRNERLSAKEMSMFSTILLDKEKNWEFLFDYFQDKQPSINDLLMGPDFHELVTNYYNAKYPRTVFTDFLWTMRSVFLNLFMSLKSPIVDADVYHSVSSGYAGVLACCAGHRNNKPVILSEHGIYTREREEDIIRATWTKGIYKDIWIDFFYMLSNCIYERATKVFSLFERSRDIQLKIGCDIGKTEVIPNGIDLTRFSNLAQKEKTHTHINIGAVVRMTPIKDIKTLINSFHIARIKKSDMQLYIIGNTDEDPDYYKECVGLVELLNAKNIIFTGHVNVDDYVGKMDMIVLTSLSEGQPLSILEAMAAGKPCITTNVGDCHDMLNAGDMQNRAGLITKVMNVNEMSEAMLTLADDAELRKLMGKNGKKIVNKKYNLHEMIKKYDDVYRKLY